MEPIASRIAAGDTLVCDGATGTMLFELGLEPGSCPDEIALSQPAMLEELAERYFAVGSDIVETNTFGASPLKLAQYELDDRAEEINRIAVERVKAVVDGSAYVGGSVGPCGKILQPYGDASESDVYESFRRQVVALIGAGVDCILIETMMDLTETQLAIKAAKDCSPEMTVSATMTFDATPRGFYTIMGTDIATAAAGLKDAGADVIGSNCGNGVEKMVEIARAFRQATDHPLIIQSNAGLPETEGGRVVYRETPEFMAERVKVLMELGISIVGGCCGTTPEHISAFREVVDSPLRSEQA